MSRPGKFELNWVHVTAIGFVLLSSSFVWFYFHGWQVVKNLPKQSADAYPPIWIDYYPSHAQSLISLCGLVLFLGSLIFGLSRSAYRIVRRLLSPGPRVR
jgi:hypothetical protein